MKLSPDQRAAFERRAKDFQRKSRHEYVEMVRAREVGSGLARNFQDWHKYHSAEARSYLFMLIGEKPWAT